MDVRCPAGPAIPLGGLAALLAALLVWLKVRKR